MNRFQANLCLVCVTLCWASEVVIYACIPDEVPEYATMCVTSLAGTALMLVPFWGRVAAAVRKAGWRFVLAMLGVAALSAAYNYHFIAGLEFFGVVDGAFASCMTVITMPFVMLAMRRRVEPATWLSVAVVTAGILLVLVPSLSAANTEGLVVLLVGCALCSLTTLFLADLVLPAGLITRIELSPRVVVGAAFVVAGSLAQILDFGALRVPRGVRARGGA